MEYCKYHPKSPATFFCQKCQVFSCDSCTDEGDYRSHERCFNCGSEVDHLGSSYTAKPFWRRLEESFKYPMNPATIGLIIAFGFLSAVFSYVPFSWFLHLAIFGGMLKYCLDSLEQTAEGNFRAPDITAAYSGGVQTALRVSWIFIILGAMVFFAYNYLGNFIGSTVALFVIFSMPSMLINYGVSRSVIEAVNPINMLKLITAIGMPYGLIIAFIMIMFASVDVIAAITGNSNNFFSIFVENAITYYYMIVMFHLMGYMVFQYQNRLGFVAREVDAEHQQPRTREEKDLARISILVKEGDYANADKVFRSSLKDSPNNKILNKQYFDFLLATHRREPLNLFATDYLEFLYHSNQKDKIRNAYKDILKLIPKYIPKTASCRFHVAKVCHQHGEHKLTIRLINGLFKAHPDFVQLTEAYELIVESLKFIPNMEAQVERHEKLVTQLKKRQPSSKKNATEKTNQTTFELEPKSEPMETDHPRDLPPLEFKL